MKHVVLTVAVATIVSAAGTSSAGITGGARQSVSGAPSLVLVGPVEAVNASRGLVVVLGQSILTSEASQLSVGDTVSVIGNVKANGNVEAKAVQKAGLYVAGATQVLLTGVVQKADNSVGRAVVNGVSVDLTPLMASGAVSLNAGDTVEIEGTQPANGGVVLVSGITGGALTQGITGGALTSGITGGALTSGITGGALTSGITGGALTQGITGGAIATQGITGGAKTSGITGGALTSGITGGALTSGITGGAVTTQGITGGAL